MVNTGDMERFCAVAYPQLVGALAHHFGDAVLAEEPCPGCAGQVCDRWETVSALESGLVDGLAVVERVELPDFTTTGIAIVDRVGSIDTQRQLLPTDVPSRGTV